MDHTLLIQQIESILEDETDVIANLANVSAVIKMNMEHINWVGFYIYKEDELVLGPFQGNVACTRLKDKGVCISALNQKQTLNVPDVHVFEGHVVCDSASNSELVVPLFIDDKPFGVLDIDSPNFNRFTEKDQETFEIIGKILETHLSKAH